MLVLDAYSNKTVKNFLWDSHKLSTGCIKKLSNFRCGNGNVMFLKSNYILDFHNKIFISNMMGKIIFKIIQYAYRIKWVGLLNYPELIIIKAGLLIHATILSNTTYS